MRNIFIYITILLYSVFNYSNAQHITTVLKPDWHAEGTVYDLKMSEIAIEDEKIRMINGVDPFGRIVNANLDIHNSGEWKENAFIPSGYTWKTRVFSFDAEGMNVYLDNLQFQEGAYMRITNLSNKKEHVFSAYDLRSKNFYCSYPLKGNNLLIEYHSDVLPEEAPFRIYGIGIIYEDIFSSEARGGGSCHVGVECSEGSNWEDQKDAVVRLIISEDETLFGCTGTLMNNTSGDQRGLVLSAFHCMDEASEQELANAIVTFNYQRPSCGSGFAPENNFLIGVIKLADSNDAVDGQSNPSGSDFALIEIQDEIPSSWNPYWAGWNAENAASSSGVTIHHPDGGDKKVSTYSSTTVSTFLGAPGSHWAATWVSTTNGHGVTEAGSSGSPLFNADGLVMGTLTGGFSSCVTNGNSGPNQPDYFGKLSYHWSNNPNSANDKLRVWLDPLNSGVTTLEGSHNPVVSVKEYLERDNFQLYPNPVEDDLTVFFDNPTEISDVSVINQLGKVVISENISGLSKVLNVSNLPPGLYLFKVRKKSLVATVKVFVKK